MKQNASLAHSSLISRIWQSVASRLSLAPRSKKDEIEFQSNGVLTLGVEIELQLIEKATLNLAPRAD